MKFASVCPFNLTVISWTEGMMERIPRETFHSINSIWFAPTVFSTLWSNLSRNLFFNFLLWWPFQTIVASRQIKFCKKKSDEAAAAEVLQNEIRSINHFKNGNHSQKHWWWCPRIASSSSFGHDTKSIIMRQSCLCLLWSSKLLKKVFLRNFFLSAH